MCEVKRQVLSLLLWNGEKVKWREYVFGALSQPILSALCEVVNYIVMIY